jgi:hypothetical protein
MGMAGGNNREAPLTTITPPHTANGKFGLNVYYIGLKFINLSEYLWFIPEFGKTVFAGNNRRKAGHPEGRYGFVIVMFIQLWVGGTDNKYPMPPLLQVFRELIHGGNNPVYPGPVRIGKKHYVHRV